MDKIPPDPPLAEGGDWTLKLMTLIRNLQFVDRGSENVSSQWSQKIATDNRQYTTDK